MKKLFGLSAVFALLLSAPTAYGNFSIDELHVASQLATTSFVASHPSHSAHITGYKTWKTGLDAKVKIYVTHGTHAMEFDYLCEQYDGEIEWFVDCGVLWQTTLSADAWSAVRY